MKCDDGRRAADARARSALDGAEIAGLPAHKVARRGVGLVFQHSRPLDRQTVLENIEVALLPDKLTHALRRRRTSTRRRARSPSASASRRWSIAGRRRCRSPTCAGSSSRRRSRAIRKLVLVDEPFAGLTASEVAAFSELIREFRAEGRAVLLVDHNVKGVSALVDRVLAMYLGERIAEGSATEVMRDETVRRVYLGGALTRVERPATAAAGRRAGAAGRGRRRAVRQGARARSTCRCTSREAEFVSVVGLNGAGKTTLFNAISGLVPHSGIVRWCGDALRGASAGRDRARRHRAVPRDARTVRRDERAREPRPRRQRTSCAANARRASQWLFELFPILSSAADADRADAVAAASSRCSRSRAR